MIYAAPLRSWNALILFIALYAIFDAAFGQADPDTARTHQLDMGHLPTSHEMPVRCAGSVTRCLSLPNQAISVADDADEVAAAVVAAAQSHMIVTAGSTDALEQQLSHASPAGNPAYSTSIPLGQAAAYRNSSHSDAASSTQTTEPMSSGAEQSHSRRFMLASTTQARTAATAPAQAKRRTPTDGPASSMNAPVWRRLLRGTAEAAWAAAAGSASSTYTTSSYQPVSHGPAALMNAPIYDEEGFKRLLLSSTNVKASTATAARSDHGPAPRMNTPLWRRLLLSTSASKTSTAAQFAVTSAEKGTVSISSGPSSMNAPVFRRHMQAAAAMQASTTTAAAYKLSAGPATVGVEGPAVFMKGPVHDDDYGF